MPTHNPTFAEAFRLHLMPRLKPRFPICAALVMSGLRTFGDEVSVLVSTAWRLGGSRLDDNLWDELVEWIETQLMLAFDRLESQREPSPAVRDVMKLFAQQEAEIAALRAERDELRASLAWTMNRTMIDMANAQAANAMFGEIPA